MNTNRYAIDSFIKYISRNNSKVTEKEMPKSIQRELQQAIYNKEYENKHKAYALKALKEINRSISYENDRPLHRIAVALNKKKDMPYITPEQYMRRAINYENYNPVYLSGQEMANPAHAATTWQAFKALLQNDKSYNAQNSIGAADYTIDKKGNVILKDRYNFNKGTRMGSPALDIIHEIAKFKNRGAFNTEVNLGNINDWNMKYTGNTFTRPLPDDNPDNILGRGVYQKSYDGTGYQR